MKGKGPRQAFNADPGRSDGTPLQPLVLGPTNNVAGWGIVDAQSSIISL